MFAPVLPRACCWIGRTTLRGLALTPPATSTDVPAVVELALDEGAGPGTTAWAESLAARFVQLARLPWMQAEVVVALEGSLALTKVFALPPSPRAQRRRLVVFEAQQRLPFALADVRWSHGLIGEREAWVVAVRRDVIAGIERAAQASGLRVSRALPMAVLLAQAAAGRNPAPAGAACIVAELEGVWELLILDGPHTSARTVVRPPGSTGEAECLAQELARTFAHHQRQGGAAPQSILFAADHAPPAPVLRRLGDDMGGSVDVAVGVARTAALGAPGLPAETVAIGDLIRQGTRVMRAVRKVVPAVNVLSPPFRRRTLLRRSAWSLGGAMALIAVALAFPLARHATQLADVRQRLEQRRLERRQTQHLATAVELHRVGLRAAREEAARWRSVHAAREAWPRWLHELDQRTASVPGLWLERVAWDAAERGSPVADDTTATPGATGATARTKGGRLIISGALFDAALTRAPVSDAMFETVRGWLAGLVDVPGIEAIEHERFTPSAPGLLRFDVILLLQVANPAAAEAS